LYLWPSVEFRASLRSCTVIFEVKEKWDVRVEAVQAPPCYGTLGMRTNRLDAKHKDGVKVNAGSTNRYWGFQCTPSPLAWYSTKLDT
jgi:hypothetical protein